MKHTASTHGDGSADPGDDDRHSVRGSARDSVSAPHRHVRAITQTREPPSDKAQSPPLRHIMHLQTTNSPSSGTPRHAGPTDVLHHWGACRGQRCGPSLRSCYFAPRTVAAGLGLRLLQGSISAGPERKPWRCSWMACGQLSGGTGQPRGQLSAGRGAT